MSKLNINFNNKNFSFDEAVLAEAKASIKAHLTSTISGSGATIEFDGAEYSIDSTKLAAAEDNFASYLDAITGETPEEEVLEGSGSEYYTLAPTALSFRSTEPLAEFQEVQVNGQVVNPANYTLEEGSTIVKLSVDYLKTLNTGNYEVTVVSQNKTVNGNFTVAAPSLNEYGFYYNQPYTAYVEFFGGNTVFFLREGGLMDTMVIENQYTEICSYAFENDTFIINAAAGTFTGSITENGIYCNELNLTFELGTNLAFADEDYIYIYNENLGGYEVTAIDKTKSEYGAIKTGINGIDTVAIANWAFADSFNMTVTPTIISTITNLGINAFANCQSLISITIPASVTAINSGAFGGCTSLENIIFEGTVAQWNAITFESIYWHMNVPATYVQCSDGQVAL